MIIEQNTEYSKELYQIEDPCFDDIFGLTIKMGYEDDSDVFESIKRGTAVLSKESQMICYMRAYGKMHQAKLGYAFGEIAEDFLEQKEINIIDYGCGQGIGAMCYADFLNQNDIEQHVRCITLIDPSETCLKRAALNASVLHPYSRIKTVNSSFDHLKQEDIECSEVFPTLHILSNVLDMEKFNLHKFAKLVKDSLKGYNQFVCVGPYFMNDLQDGRMDVFSSKFKGNDSYEEELGKGELDYSKDWTCKLSLFTVGKPLTEQNFSTDIQDYIDMGNPDKKDFVEDENGMSYTIDWKVFFGNSSDENNALKSYSVKNGTLVIGNAAAALDRPFQQLYIPESVVNIGEGAFYNNKNLKQVLITGSVAAIKVCSFCGCESLRQVMMPKSIIAFGDNAFDDCESLQQINMPDSLRFIGNACFHGCKSLKYIELPCLVNHIGKEAFWLCTSLQQITIPESVSAIEEKTFSCCTSLQQVTLPATIGFIGEDAFYNCRSLKRIIIPKGTTEHFKELLDNWLWDKLVEE